VLFCVAGFLACDAGSTESGDQLVEYRVLYTVTPEPDSGTVRVRMLVEQARFLLRELRMTVDPEKITDIDGDGEVEIDESQVLWRPGARGGYLSWRMRVANRRNGDGYDAWLGDEWGVFRAEDIVPRAATRTLKGASSNTTLEFELPRSWAAVTEYFGRDQRFEIRKDERRFDQPSGWILVGDLGVRRDEIANTRIAVAAPKGLASRRLEMLALLRWTLPELARVLPALPKRITIISAGEPMWRGALSAPASLFIHAERPLISENATSTLLHEVVHVAAGLDGAEGYDWIVEGIAEYYGLEMLFRSGTISEKRYGQARAAQARWGRKASKLCGPHSAGATTALAVTVLARLDREVRELSDDSATLDDVVSELSQFDGKIDLALLRETAEEIAGQRIETLHTDNLPGCRTMAAGQQ
jgi:hypothetical protein